MIYVYMIIIDVKKVGGLDKALKILKSKVIKTKQNQELNKRKEFVKKSVLKREKFKKAKFIESLKNNH